MLSYVGVESHHTEQNRVLHGFELNATQIRNKLRKELGLKTSLPNVTQTNSVYTVIRWIEKFDEFQETGRAERKVGSGGAMSKVSHSST